MRSLLLASETPCGAGRLQQRQGLSAQPFSVPAVLQFEQTAGIDASDAHHRAQSEASDTSVGENA